MSTIPPVFKNILVATDFSPHADAALRQAVWLARQANAKITLVHTLPDLRRVMYTASLEARMDLFYGEGNQFQEAVREKSNTRMRRMIADLQATDLNVTFETIMGEPYLQITHAVLAEKFDLVVAGSRGLTAWERFFVGSTAKRLIRKCPSSVWIVKAETTEPAKVILAPTDFSEVSRKAALRGYWLAQEAGAQFHLLHVYDSLDVPEDFFPQLSEGGSLREEIRESAKMRMETFLDELSLDRGQIHVHLSQGVPWKEIHRLTTELSVDLIAMGTVGRGGIKGLLLGNTAEKVLDSCDCGILTVKPDDFVSPIPPATWPLHG